MEMRQDFFISHASDDKSIYVQPLAESLTKRQVTFWLDSYEIGWGDSLALKINEGLRESRHVLLCLSEAFLARPWPETELNAAFALKSDEGGRKVLPLILNGKDRILAQYPLIAGLVFREYRDPETTAEELATLARNQDQAAPAGYVHVVVESVHTGHLSNLVVSPRSSIGWLTDKAKSGAGLHDSLETGGFQRFAIRWVLVDVNAEDRWKAMDKSERQSIHAIVNTGNGIQIAASERTRLADIGVYNDVVFHLYAVEDIQRNDDDDGGVCYSSE
jgi:hypothetical protein